MAPLVDCSPSRSSTPAIRRDWPPPGASLRLTRCWPRLLPHPTRWMGAAPVPRGGMAAVRGLLVVRGGPGRHLAGSASVIAAGPAGCYTRLGVLRASPPLRGLELGGQLGRTGAVAGPYNLRGAGSASRTARASKPARCAQSRPGCRRRTSNGAPLLRPVDRFGRVQDQRLSDKAVARLVKKHARAVGLDPARCSRGGRRLGEPS